MVPMRIDAGAETGTNDLAAETPPSSPAAYDNPMVCLRVNAPLALNRAPVAPRWQAMFPRKDCAYNPRSTSSNPQRRRFRIERLLIDGHADTNRCGWTYPILIIPAAKTPGNPLYSLNLARRQTSVRYRSRIRNQWTEAGRPLGRALNQTAGGSVPIHCRPA